MSLTKSVSKPTNFYNDTITYSITYVNNTGSDITNYSVWDSLPTSLNQIQYLWSSSGSATAGSMVYWNNLGTVTSGGGGSLTIAVLATGAEEVAFRDLVFPTPSGKLELLSEEAARRWGVDPLPGFTEPSPGGHPLTLLTPNHKNSIHSQFVTLDVLRALDPGPRLHLGPEDAEARGIRQGDAVRVFNERGELFLPANVDLSLAKGCVVAFNGYGAEHGGSVNLLSLGRETDMGHGAAFHDNRVDVEKAP